MRLSGRFEVPQADARTRYPGTAPFGDSPADRARFFGREKETDELYLRVLSVPLLVQFGRSGLGKTSLLQAGLFPRLRERGKAFLPVMVRLNERDTSLAAAVARSFRESCASEGLEANIDDTAGLWELLSSTTVWRHDLLLTPVLVFDQFEEVFTLRDAAFRKELAAELGAIATGVPPSRLQDAKSPAPDVKVVISLREDYLGALEEFSTAIPGLFHERLRLEALLEDEARKAITNPALLTAAEGEQPFWCPPFRLDPATLDRMIAFLKDSAGVIEPFQLQLLCRHAERLAKSRQDRMADGVIALTAGDFTTDQFEAVLKNFYRDTLAKVSPPAQRPKVARLCEEGLLGGSKHRLLLEETQILDDYGVTPETLATLSAERLIVRERRNETTFYEITHDRLAESIYAARRWKVPRKTRRLILATSLAAAIVVAFVIAFLLQRTQAVAAERRAVQKERDSAEALITFLLGEDFLGEVRDTGRSTMLAQVQNQVGKRDGTARNRALALRGEADLRRVEGKLAESVRLQRAALAAFQRAGNDRDTAREIARSHERLAELLQDQGLFTEARRHYADADGAWVRAAATQEDCLDRARMLNSSAFLEHRRGEETLATRELDKAVAIVFDVVFGGRVQCTAPPGAFQPYPPPAVMAVLSEVAAVRASQYQYGEDADAAVRLFAEARKQNPSSLSMRHDAIVAIAARGALQHKAQDQLNDYLAAMAETEELRAWDPQNRLWQRERAANELLLSGAIVACNAGTAGRCKPLHPLAEAEAIALEALATLRTLATLDDTNLSLKSDVAWALQVLSEVHSAAGRYEESLARLAEAERIAHTLGSETSNPEKATYVAGTLLNIADVQAALKRNDDAAETLQRGIDIVQALVAAHPDDVSYLRILKGARMQEAALRRTLGDRSRATFARQEIEKLDAALEAIQASDLARNVKATALHGHVDAATALLAQQKFAEALGKLRAAETAAREYLRFDPTLSEWYERLRETYELMAAAYAGLGDKTGYASALYAQMNAAQLASWLAPDDRQEGTNSNLLQARMAVTAHLRNENKPEAALEMVQEVVVVAGKLVETFHDEADYVAILGSARCTVGAIRRDLRSPGWEEPIRSGLIELERAARSAKDSALSPKYIGLWRGYLAGELAKDGNPGAAAEFIAAKQALRRAVQLQPDDAEAQQALAALPSP